MPFNTKHIPLLVISILVILQVAGFLLTDIVRVSEREVAIITRFGQVIDQRTAGWSVKIPYIDNVAATYDLTVKSFSVEALSATKDQQTVKIKVNVQYKIDSSKGQDIFRLVKDQKSLEDFIVPPFIQESVKASSAKYTASELLEKRDMFKSDVEKALQERLKEYFASVVAVNIENVDWSDQFDRAVEEKVIAEQGALRKKQELEQAKIQAEIDITKARTEAESTKIRGAAIRDNPETLEKAKIDKWDGKLPQVQGGTGTIIDLTNNK